MALHELIAQLPVGAVHTDRASLEAHRHDDGEWAEFGTPLAVVQPETAEHVQTIVQWAIEHQTPVVARGAGTGLSGAANAIDGCLVVCFDRMNQILEVNPTERWVRVQPGLVNDHLRDHLAPLGLWYPPDPASSPWAQIGGNIATNAGGMCCVKYGVTSDYVLELQVVTGRGELIRVGKRTAKGVAGYDLVHLLVGSEGTLALVTEAVLRVRPLPPKPRTIVGHFNSLVDAGRAVTAVSSAGLIPSALELIDQHCIRAVDEWKGLGLGTTATAVLIARTDSPGAVGEQEAAELAQIFAEAGATLAEVSRNDAESDALYSARRLAYPALERLGPMLTEDVCVPMGAVPQMLVRIEQIAQQHGALIANIAHAGDGNLHPLIITDTGDLEAQRRAQTAFDEIVSATLELGGTVTGEHGVGLLKLKGLAEEFTPEVINLHHDVKQVFDPHGILNPGKAIPPRQG